MAVVRRGGDGLRHGAPVPHAVRRHFQHRPPQLALFGGIKAGLGFTAAAMFISGAIVLLTCEETHPRFNPVRETGLTLS